MLTRSERLIISYITYFLLIEILEQAYEKIKTLRDLLTASARAMLGCCQIVYVKRKMSVDRLPKFGYMQYVC